MMRVLVPALALVSVVRALPVADGASDELENCDTWYDGCNTCSVEDGHITVCTMAMCFTQGDAYCMKYTESEDSEVPEDCKSWFDGCNKCFVQDGEVQGCTRMFCTEYSDAYCMEYEKQKDSKAGCCVSERWDTVSPISNALVQVGFEYKTLDQESCSSSGGEYFDDSCKAAKKYYEDSTEQSSEDQTGCCVSYGYGSMMVPCCFGYDDTVAETACIGGMMGGNMEYFHGTCEDAKVKYEEASEPDYDVQPGCILWFDGCNQCQVSDSGEVTGCTKMFCETYDNAYCVEFGMD